MSPRNHVYYASTPGPVIIWKLFILFPSVLRLENTCTTDSTLYQPSATRIHYTQATRAKTQHATRSPLLSQQHDPGRGGDIGVTKSEPRLKDIRKDEGEWDEEREA